MDCKSIICDANNLYEAYEKTIKGSKWKETTQKFALNYLRNIFKLQDELSDQTYLPETESHFILHERGKIRPITTLTPRDRVVRHVLCDDVLFPKIFPKLIYDNYASIKGRGVYMARERFEVHLRQYFMRNKSNKGYILFGDFTKFYDNIIHDIAKQQFSELCDNDPYLSWLLDVIFTNFRIDVSHLTDKEYETCMTDIFDKLKYKEIPSECFTQDRWMEKSVNIGDQLSQLVGIFYPNEIDTYVKTVAGMKEYGRYVDDFYIMAETKEELHDLLNDICRIADRLGIHINKKKTRIVKMDGTYTYLQVKYQITDSAHIIKRINPKRVTCMKRRLKKLKHQLDIGETDYIPIEEMYKSWMGGFYKLMSKQQRKHLIHLYETLFDKKVTISKKSGERKLEIKDKKEVTKNDVQSANTSSTKSTYAKYLAEHESKFIYPYCMESTANADAAVCSKLEQTSYDESDAYSESAS